MSGLTRRALLAGGSVAALLTMARDSLAAFAIFSASSSSGQPSFSSIATGPLSGAGGWVTGVNFANDGTAYARTDTSPSPWRLDPGATAWVPLAFGGSVALPLTFSDGVYEVATCATDSTKVCMMLAKGCSAGSMFYSSNKGQNWTAATGFPSIAAAVNTATATYYGSARMACDPANASYLIAVHPTSGVHYSTDGAHTWTLISTSSIPVPTGTANGIVIFDPSSTTGGSTPTIYVFSSGNGWYKTTGGVTGSWALTTSSPTNSTFGAIDASNGTLYAGSGSTTVNLFNGTTWSTATCSVSVQSIATDPATSGRAVAIQQNTGLISVTTNSGVTWSTANLAAGTSCTSGPLSVAWIVWATSQIITQSAYIDVARIAFDPSASNSLYATNGVGVLQCNPNNAPHTTGPTWVDVSAGIENMVINKIISPPGSGPVSGQWDRSFTLIPYPGGFPAQYGPYDSSIGSLSQGWSMTWAPGATNVIAGISNYGTERSGYSLDGGRSWTKFSSETPGNSNSNPAGSIAASSASDIAWVGTGSSPAAEMYYTTSGGSSWTGSSGIATGSFNGNYYDYPDQLLCNDKVTGTTFYALRGGSIYKSTDSGATFASVSSPGFGAFPAWLDSVPGQAGHLFFCSSFNSSSTGTAFKFSSNGGTTWATATGISSVWAFGFGAAYPGQSYPTVYAFGYVGSTWGIYRCTNFNPATPGGTWTLVQSFANGIQDNLTAISGDTDVFGWIYVGYQGSGTRRIVCNDAAPWIKPSAPYPGQTVTGSSVTLTALAASEIAHTSVSWQIDGSSIGVNALTGTWDSTTVGHGAHTLSIISTGNGQTTTVSIPIVTA